MTQTKIIEIAGLHFCTENLKAEPNNIDVFERDWEHYFTRDAAMREAKKIGMRLPSDDEWETALQSMDGSTRDEKYVALRTRLNIPLVGWRLLYGDSDRMYNGADFRSSNLNYTDRVWGREFCEDGGYKRHYNKKRVLSVRLVQDPDSFDNSTITTSEQQGKIEYKKVPEWLSKWDYGAKFGYELHEFLRDFNLL